MDSKELFRALGDIDADFIEEAQTKPRKHSVFPKLLTACACVVLVLCVGWGGGYLLKNHMEFEVDPLCAEATTEPATPVAAMPQDFAFGSALGSDVWFYDNSTYILTWADDTNGILPEESLLQKAWESVAVLNWEDYPDDYRLGNLPYEMKPGKEVSFTVTENEQTHVVRFSLEELLFSDAPEAKKLLTAFLSCRRTAFDTAARLGGGRGSADAAKDAQYSDPVPEDFTVELNWGTDNLLLIRSESVELQSNGEKKSLAVIGSTVLNQVWQIAQEMNLKRDATVYQMSGQEESGDYVTLRLTKDGQTYEMSFLPSEILAAKNMESQRLLEVLQICCQTALAD